ncbi:UNVERIFIED_CONTAM: hypothetical protein HDU68_009279, partial [Siphonaria sp. JEL0065]
IDSIADTDRILKLSWLIVSVGYKMYEKFAKEQEEFQKLLNGFRAGSERIVFLKSISTKGIRNDTRILLAKGLDGYLKCLIEVLSAYIQYWSGNSRIEVFSIWRKCRDAEGDNIPIG